MTKTKTIKPILVAWDAEFVAQIDQARGDVPRTVWIRRACERAIPIMHEGGFVGPDGQRYYVKSESTFEGEVLPRYVEDEDAAHKAAKKAGIITQGRHLPNAPSTLSFGPVTPKPGSRLKTK